MQALPLERSRPLSRDMKPSLYAIWYTGSTMPPRHERRVHEAQMSFLRPDDAEFVHLLRRFIAEASRIYEAKTGRPREDALQITSPRDAYEFVRVEMEHLEQEQVRVITLDTKNRIISCPMIYQGTLNSSPVRPAEVFRPAIIDNAHAIIIAHNHPSGAPRSA